MPSLSNVVDLHVFFQKVVFTTNITVDPSRISKLSYLHLLLCSMSRDVISSSITCDDFTDITHTHVTSVG